MLIEDMVDLGDDHGDDNTKDWEMRTGLAKMEKPTYCFHAKQETQFG